MTIDQENFELYRFKVGACFWDTVYSIWSTLPQNHGDNTVTASAICGMIYCMQGFADRNTSTARNFCRNPGHPESCHRERPWCYYGSGSQQWEYCYVPLCGVWQFIHCSLSILTMYIYAAGSLFYISLFENNGSYTLRVNTMYFLYLFMHKLT